MASPTKLSHKTGIKTMPIIGHGMSFVKSNNSRNMHHAKTSNWNDIAKYAVLSLADIGVLFALLWIIRNV